MSLHVGEQVAVGRGDHAHIHPPRLGRADALDLAVLDDAQELGLHGERELANFVQEQRTAVRLFEEPGLGLGRARERATYMAKELAFEQRFDHCRTVHHHEGTRASGSELVKSPRHQFLACAGFARHQRCPNVRRQTPDHVEQFLHHGTSADHPVKLELLRQLRVSPQERLPPLDALAHRDQQLAEAVEVERLGQVVERAKLDGLDGGVDAGVTGHETDLACGQSRPNLPQHIQTIDVRHLEVDERDVRLDIQQGRQRRARARVRQDGERQRLREPLDQRDDARIVVDDQKDGL